MKKITVKEYARLNRVSVYQVIKKIQRGELQGVTLEENGMKVNYVVLDEADGPVERAEAPAPATLPSAMKSEGPAPSDLAAEVARLREEVAALRALMERCCAKLGAMRPEPL